MSSVQSFLKQVPAGLSFVNPDSLTASCYDFVPASGNYVGNYPPGYVVPAASSGLSTALSNAKLVANGQFLLRDMGKTIYCPYAATIGGSLTTAPSGFFREYQLLVVNPISATYGFIGGVNGNNFGVVGPSVSTSGSSTYCTLYLPSVVAGVGCPFVGSFPAINSQASGQM